MIIVTGAAGFIGSNIINGLNQAGIQDIIAVDDLTNGHQYVNLSGKQFADYLDREELLQQIINDKVKNEVKAIIHQGACAVTTEWNGRYMMQNNYEYTKQLFQFCKQRNIQFIYASSGAVYGDTKEFNEADPQQKPLNVYGYSKWQFDQYMLRYLPTTQSQVVGLRYFNVYGPHEQHKAGMASVAFHFMNQLYQDNEIRMFEGSHGYPNGGHLRDFVYVGDIVKVNLWLLQNPQVKGIFNVGTGQARPFSDVGNILINLHGSGVIRYIPFPDTLKDAYQAYTQANITALRQAGYTADFTSLENGLADYYQWHRENIVKKK